MKNRTGDISFFLYIFTFLRICPHVYCYRATVNILVEGIVFVLPDCTENSEHLLQHPSPPIRPPVFMPRASPLVDEGPASRACNRDQLVFKPNRNQLHQYIGITVR